MSTPLSDKKVCAACKKDKAVGCFSHDKSRLDGRRYSCKDCEREFKSKNADKIRFQSRENYIRNREIRIAQIKRYQQSERGRSLAKKRRDNEAYKLSARIYKKRSIRKSVSELSDSYVRSTLRNPKAASKEIVEEKRRKILIHRTKHFFGLVGTTPQLESLTMENMDKDISHLIALITQGAECLEKAGKLLLEMEKRNPDVCKLILKKCPSMSLSRLETLKRVGRGELNPYLLLDASCGAQRLLELPRSAQDKYMTEPIPVAVVIGGNAKVEYKQIQELSRNESEIVFNSRRLRSPEEQVEMIRNRLASRQTRQSIRYAIDGEKVTFYAHSTFTREQLEEILGKIPKCSANQIESTIKKNQISK